MYKLRSYNVDIFNKKFEEIIESDDKEKLIEYILDKKKNEKDELVITTDDQKLEDFFNNDNPKPIRIQLKGMTAFSSEVYKEFILEKKITDFDCYLLILSTFENNRMNIKKVNNKEEYINIVNEEIKIFNDNLKRENKIIGEGFKADDPLSSYIRIRNPIGFDYNMIKIYYLSRKDYAELII